MKLRGLRQARQRSGISIGQLAEATGLRRETIAHLEHGQEDPQPYVLRRLAAVLGVGLDELYEGHAIASTLGSSPESRELRAPPRRPVAAR